MTSLELRKGGVMEPVWFALFSAIFIILVLKSQVDMMKEEKYFLREDNISLRTDLKKIIFKMENSCNNQNWPEEWVEVKEKVKKKNQEKTSKPKYRDRIFIFNDSKSEEDAEKLVSFRNFLKGHSINEIVLVDLETLVLKLSDESDDSVVEEIIFLNNNPENLPIIFYGGNHESFLSLSYFFCWIDRFNMVWIEDPWDIDDLKDVLEEIKED